MREHHLEQPIHRKSLTRRINYLGFDYINWEKHCEENNLKDLHVIDYYLMGTNGESLWNHHTSEEAHGNYVLTEMLHDIIYHNCLYTFAEPGITVNITGVNYHNYKITARRSGRIIYPRRSEIGTDHIYRLIEIRKNKEIILNEVPIEGCGGMFPVDPHSRMYNQKDGGRSDPKHIFYNLLNFNIKR